MGLLRRSLSLSELIIQWMSWRTSLRASNMNTCSIFITTKHLMEFSISSVSEKTISTRTVSSRTSSLTHTVRIITLSLTNFSMVNEKMVIGSWFKTLFLLSKKRWIFRLKKLSAISILIESYQMPSMSILKTSPLLSTLRISWVTLNTISQTWSNTPKNLKVLGLISWLFSMIFGWNPSKILSTRYGSTARNSLLISSKKISLRMLIHRKTFQMAHRWGVSHPWQWAPRTSAKVGPSNKQTTSWSAYNQI